MGDAPALKKLKDQLEAVLAKDKLKEATELLGRLEGLEPTNARWSHRLGDVLRRAGNTQGALAAYERAAQRYAKAGLLARAVAMAKTVTSIDAGRSEVLASLRQGDARGVRSRVRPQLTTAHSPGRALLQQAAALAPAQDAAADEVRFVDVEPVDLELPTLPDNEQLHPEATTHSLPPEPTQRAEHLASLPLFALFADVPHEVLLELTEASELIEAEPGTYIIHRGDPADALYGVVAGKVRVVAPGFTEEEQPLLGEGEVFGEACLLADEARHADVIVEEQLTALRIPKALLDQLVDEHEEVGGVLINLLIGRLLSLLLRISPLFRALDPEAQSQALQRFEIRSALSGTILEEAGKRGDGLYIPLTGKLELIAADGSTCVRPAGTLVGEASLLTRAPAEATVRTLGYAVLLRLPSSSFMELIAQYPTVLEELSVR